MRAPPKYWSMAQAIGLSIALMVVFLLSQLGSFLLLQFLPFWVSLPILSLGEQVVYSTIMTAMAMMMVCGLLVKLTKRADFLLNIERSATFWDWGLFGKALVSLAVFLLVGTLLGEWLGKDPIAFMDELMVDTSVGLLFVVMVLVAPIYEEVLFRGVIFGLIEKAGKPIAAMESSFTKQCLNNQNNADFTDISLTKTSQKRLWLASLVSSFLFALVHLQYDWFGFVLIFVLALGFCWFKIRSKSLRLPIILHILNNAIAMLFYLWDKW